MAIVGVLALQGAVDAHIRMLIALGASARRVRSAEELTEVERLIIPGGESTTMLTLLKRVNLWGKLAEFGKRRPVWGICAGAILIARQVINPEQESLGLIDLKAHRNYYGSQAESFKATIPIEPLGIDAEVDFIRAPLLERYSNDVRALAKYNGQPVLFQQNRILASSFHIELGTENRLHEYFLSL